MIRWSYLAPRLILLGLVWAVMNFLFDPALRRGLEVAGGKSLGARVEIGGLDTGLFPPTVLMERVAAADPQEPMRNLVEFDSLGMRLEGRPLLEKKLVVEISEIHGLRWGAARARSGALKGARTPAGVRKLQAWAGGKKDYLKGLGGLGKGAAAPRVDPKELSALRVSEKLETQWKAKFEQWDQRVASLDADGRIKEIESLLKKAAGSGSLPEKLKAAKALGDQVKGLRGEIDSAKKELDAGFGDLQSELDAVKNAKEGDMNALFAKLNLPSFDAESLSAYLIGPKAAGAVGKALRLVDASRKKMPAKGKAGPRAARRGASVEFPKERAWPSFWVKSLRLSGEAELGGPVPFLGEGPIFPRSRAWSANPRSSRFPATRERALSSSRRCSTAGPRSRPITSSSASRGCRSARSSWGTPRPSP
ncbi:MAG: hypothetical protein ABII00_10305 [Elusimicrobiota bacterium]